ncbi:hypothetical protein BDW22DRAFT_947625 [Trametopsis cervina]|nr:hypothetical protein BDW22DRAFT_947625 [Trametopsis cervina]
MPCGLSQHCGWGLPERETPSLSRHLQSYSGHYTLAVPRRYREDCTATYIMKDCAGGSAEGQIPVPPEAELPLISEAPSPTSPTQCTVTSLTARHREIDEKNFRSKAHSAPHAHTHTHSLALTSREKHCESGQSRTRKAASRNMNNSGYPSP